MGIRIVGRHTIEADCGVRLSSLIRFARSHGLGGIEYLASVPGTVGGAIFMNAGRGEPHGLAIGSHVTRVEVFDGERRRWLPTRACEFGHRVSVFQTHPEWLILSAVLRLPSQSPETTTHLVRERLRYTRATQDLGWPSAGTVFSSGYLHDAAFEGLRVGDIVWSDRTRNWMSNVGAGTFSDCCALLRMIRSAHARDPVLELCIL